MNLSYLQIIRRFELLYVLDACKLDSKAKFLDFGAGNGFILDLLHQEGFNNAVGLEIEDSNYMVPDKVKTYDGRPETIPYANDFNVIYSSNVLEHLTDIEEFIWKFNEMLENGGIQIHVVPTHYWKFYNFTFYYYSVLKYILKRLFKKKSKSETSYKKTVNKGMKQSRLYIGRHGSRGSSFDEFRLFNPSSYKTLFTSMGLEYKDFKIPLVYTGHTFLGKALPMGLRKTLSYIMGYSCHVFVISKHEKA